MGKSFVRTLLKMAPWEIAHLVVIFPTPLYFTENPGIRILTIVGLVLFAAYGISISTNSGNQSVYDQWIGTFVVV